MLMNMSSQGDLHVSVCWQWHIYHWATWVMPSPVNRKKNLAYGKNASKMHNFQAKIFFHAQLRSPRPPPNFSPISIITLDSDADIDELGNRIIG